MKLECPVCKAELVYKKVDDGFDSYRICKSGRVKRLASKSHGYDQTYCSKNADHKIPIELHNTAKRWCIFFLI